MSIFSASSNKIRVKRKPPVYSSNKKFNTSDKSTGNKTDSGSTSKKSHILTCGKPVNFTHFDHLQGIAERHTHPSFPEPEVALIFKKKNKSGNQEVNMNELEKKLWKAKKEVNINQNCCSLLLVNLYTIIISLAVFVHFNWQVSSYTL